MEREDTNIADIEAVATSVRSNHTNTLPGVLDGICDVSLVDYLCKTCETFRIVQDLLAGVKPNGEINGHMKIIRISQGNEKKRQQTDAGNRLYATLCVARKVASSNKEYMYEIIRDYDNFNINVEFNQHLQDTYDRRAVHRIRRILQPKRCQFTDPTTFVSCPCTEYTPSGDGNIQCMSSNCRHIHKPIDQYSDLNKLPCILILDRKGRMGDTFPESFNVMDLRLNFVNRKSKVCLSSLTQELGRMCRYVEKDRSNQSPYALLGEKLHADLKKCLSDSGSVLWSCYLHRLCGQVCGDFQAKS